MCLPTAPLRALVLALVAAPLRAQNPLADGLAALRQASAAGDHARADAIGDTLVARFGHNPNVVLARATALGRAGRLDAADRERGDAVQRVRVE